jgi:hypothetical protein
MKCKEPECPRERKPWNGKGRKPSYCDEHSKASQRSSRSRSKGTMVPDCCSSLGPRRKCERHKAPRRLSVGPLDPSLIHSLNWDSSSPEADPLSGSYNPYRREYMAGAIVVSHTMLSMPVKLGRMSEPFKVIGQTDLTVDWVPVRGASVPEGLIRRGVDWPFAHMASV